MLANAPISFKVGLQGLTSQSTMEAKLVAVALTIKEAVFCSNTMLELEFNESFRSVPIYSDITWRCTPPATAPTVLAQSTSR